MTALYHQAGQPPKEFTVVQRHDDGTIDFADGDVVIVKRCPVSEDGKPGTCTLQESPTEKPVEKPSKPSQRKTP